jgi:hypothetical protein
MKRFTIGSAAALALVFSLGLAGCEKEKGPAEKLGAKIDEAAGDAKEAAEEAAEEIEDAAEDAKEKAAH